MYDYPNNEADAIKQLNIQHQGILVNDPTRVINTRTSTSTDGLWSQLTDDHKNVYRSPTTLLEERMDKLELDNKLLRLKILGMEGKFTQEEIINIRKMMMSKDEASKTLAESIIENT
jgi:hypothetical protein